MNATAVLFCLGIWALSIALAGTFGQWAWGFGWLGGWVAGRVWGYFAR